MFTKLSCKTSSARDRSRTIRSDTANSFERIAPYRSANAARSPRAERESRFARRVCSESRGMRAILRGMIRAVKTSFLDFEQPIAELEQKIEELRFVQDDSAVDISQEIERLSKKSRELTKEIYGKLNAWQISKVARHPQRPYTLDYVQSICSDFEEVHGDRAFADDP